MFECLFFFLTRVWARAKKKQGFLSLKINRGKKKSRIFFHYGYPHKHTLIPNKKFPFKSGAFFTVSKIHTIFIWKMLQILQVIFFGGQIFFSCPPSL